MGREKYERQCKRKSRHEKYLSALHHAMQLSKNEIVIYPCGICDGLHVGHGFACHAAHCNRERDRLIAPLNNELNAVREMVRQQEATIKRLEKEVETLEIEYL
jgi:hypothetical protein